MLEYTESLEQAMQQNHIEVVKHFLRKNADVNHFHPGSYTALYSAILQENTEVVEFLVENGADVNISGDNEEFVPLIQACDTRNFDLVKMLVENGANVNKIDLQKRSPLYSAIQHKLYDIVVYLIDNDGDVNTTETRETLLALASKITGNEKIVEILIKKGANIDGKSVHGSHPICLAVFKGNEETVNMLIKHGVNLNVRNETGNTPLHIASMSQSVPTDIIEALLNANADVSILNKENETPLSILLPSRKNYFEEIKLFFQHGSDINGCDKYGYSPLIRITERSSPDSLEIIEFLVENGADINQCTKNGNNALLNSAKNGQIDSVKYLLEHSGEEIPNNNGELPFHYSAQSIDLIKLFMSGNNQDVNVQDVDGNTVLHHGVIMYHRCQSRLNVNGEKICEAMKYLLDNECNTDIRNKKNKTASELANDLRLYDIVELLQEKTNHKRSMEIATQTSIQLDISRQSSVSRTPRTERWDVMLSYQWASQGKVLLIKEYLEEAGIRVWMDLERMQGGLNDRMAEAVAYSKLVVLCLSDKYSKSRNCQKEYKYADQLAREIIPVKVESAFHPKIGTALSIIISDNLWYDLDEAFDKDIKKFIKAAKSKIKKIS